MINPSPAELSQTVGCSTTHCQVSNLMTAVLLIQYKAFSWRCLFFLRLNKAKTSTKKKKTRKIDLKVNKCYKFLRWQVLFRSLGTLNHKEILIQDMSGGKSSVEKWSPLLLVFLGVGHVGTIAYSIKLLVSRKGADKGALVGCFWRIYVRKRKEEGGTRE